MKAGMTRCAAVVALTIGLGACGGVLQSGLFTESFWASSPLKEKENDEAELGLAEMAKGNYVGAEGHYQRALKANAKDVHALIGQGILYQNTGQTTRAREMYEAVLAIRPKDSQRMVIWNDVSTRPVAEIASVNLALLDSGGVLASMGRGPTGPQARDERPVAPASPPAFQMVVSGAPDGTAMLGRPLATPVTATAPAVPRLANGDANIVFRFKTMRALRDQSLITQDEFATRRRANIGALLPLTSPPPAAGLDRPVPTTGQISGRLRAIGRALEMRAMSVSQHTAERSMILDALMPGTPAVVANPGKPPEGLMEAADAVRRLELLQDGGFISSDEYTRERQAIERALQPKPMASKDGITVASPVNIATAAAPAKAEGKAKGLLPAVHLASYRSRTAADRGWIRLRRAHREVLDDLESEITKVNLGPRKGIFYRLKAGPVADKAAAAEVCRRLKSRRQYCQPSFMNGT
ncbi:MAG: tetratricopeptide repeat protein [Proteobacteria bacterium]|nr:tetratricopeptide repeat protein [Pseudomonadota bacterium]